MPKLSAIANRSKVLLPLRGENIIEATKVAYNHYGKGEVLLVPNWIVKAPIGEPAYFFDTVSTTYRCSYEYSDLDKHSFSMKSVLSDTIAGSLVDVPITIQNVTNTGFDNRDEPLYRSVFLPSYQECGGVNSISYLKSTIEGYSGSGFSSVTRNPRYYSGNRSGMSWQDINGDPIIYDSTGIHDACMPYLITIDGNCEVASSSGGAITKATAIESYRKINGVWYRTV